LPFVDEHIFLENERLGGAGVPMFKDSVRLNQE
jgi:hypothetical protein